MRAKVQATAATRGVVVSPDSPSVEQIELAAQTCALLADPTRLRIIWELLRGECSVGDLAVRVSAQPAAVSQHLARLRMSRVVRTRRDGRRIYYVAENVHVAQLVAEALHHADHVVGGHSDHGPTR